MILTPLGRHRTGSGDVHDVEAVTSAIGTVDAIYSDPPWRAHDEAAFRTRGKIPPRAEQQGTTPMQRWELFTSALAQVCARTCPTGPWYIEATDVEQQRKWRDALIAAFTEQGATLMETMRVRYYEDRHCALLLFSMRPDLGWTLPRSSPEPHDNETPGLAMLHNPQLSTWLDPCLGLGITLRYAERLGRTCVGVELDPKRHDKARANYQRGPRVKHEKVMF